MSGRKQILDIWVDPINRFEAIERVKELLKSGKRPHSIFASNPEKNFSVPSDPELYKIYRDADLLLPDGIGIVWAARLLYGIKCERVPGSEFIFDICRLAVEEGAGIFIYGSKEEVNRRASEKLKNQFQGINIVGRSHGYVTEPEMPDLINRINGSKSTILFIALGSPQQEKWFASYKHQLQYVRVCQGIGGTLDTIAGTVKRAPEIWCRFNLEWLYRLILEPRRIKRQKVLPVFAAMVILSRCKKMLNSQSKNC